MTFRFLLILALSAGWLRVASAQTAELEQAIQEGRLLEPPGNNAWESYERLRRSGAPESQQRAARTALAKALRGAGEAVLRAYMDTREPRPSSPTDLLEGTFSEAEFERAAVFFERALELTPQQGVLRARAKFCRGRALVSRGAWGQAEVLLREALALDPSAPYTHNGLGIVHLSQNRNEEAVHNFRAAVERAPRWIYARHNLALACFNLRRFDEAEREWVMASLLGPRFAFPHVNLGVLYLKMGRRLDAERELEHALRLDPNGAITNHNLAVLYEVDRRLPDAEAHYRKAIEADPNHLPARMNLAEMYRRAGRTEAAVQEYRAALEVDPKNAAIYEALGDLYSAQKKSPQALENYRQALSHASDRPARDQLQRKISALASSP